MGRGRERRLTRNDCALLLGSLIASHCKLDKMLTASLVYATLAIRVLDDPVSGVHRHQDTNQNQHSLAEPMPTGRKDIHNVLTHDPRCTQAQTQQVVRYIEVHSPENPNSPATRRGPAHRSFVASLPRDDHVTSRASCLEQQQGTI